jgi:hypothetical protein
MITPEKSMTGRATGKFVRDAPQAVVPGHRIVQADEPARVGGSHAHAGGQPTIELVREGELVKAIDVTCPCGETIRIWCSYAAE